ncbi:hypothetical protein F383_37709 [Gossypium arboreum]|uniref:Uncharacterized protein n=1 Tax=Gossypium arboreum TaxID=29729 RepID=A0A0B0M8E4_GOSAR|nr:hypothetical protein F383_37709 [Gossypium arboreum]
MCASKTLFGTMALICDTCKTTSEMLALYDPSVLYNSEWFIGQQ